MKCIKNHENFIRIVQHCFIHRNKMCEHYENCIRDVFKLFSP